MADAAKSDEIEDVLSSIRRLVSEHHVPERAQAPKTSDLPPAKPATEAAPPQTEALILTPALRVTDPEDPWVPITPRETLSEVEPAPEAELSRDDGADWAQQLWAEEDATAEPTATEDPQLQADQWEAAAQPEALDEGEPAPVEALDPPLDVTEAADAGDAPETAPEDDDFPQVPLSFIRSTSSVTEYEPEEGNQGLPDADLPSAMLDLAQSRAARQEEASDDAQQEDEATRQVRVEILRATRDEPPAPELQGAQPSGPDTAPAADAPEEEPTDFLAAEAQPGPTPPDVEDLGQTPFSFPDEGDNFVDEAALRELIAEVVREELQGEMGVRITRNIRKLVRREIRLALAAQELE
jgi:hypothetical protein